MTAATITEAAGVPTRRCIVGRLLACTGGWWLVPTAALAENTGTAIDLGGLLRRLQTSSLQHNFTGVFVISTGGAMSSARLAHFGNGREQIDRIESLDGQMRRVYRHNDLVHVLWPQTLEASVEPRDLLGRLPGTAAALTRRPATATSGASGASSGQDFGGPGDCYDAFLLREERLAGYEAQVIALRPRDGYRWGQRWWVERETGLLLRSDLLGARSEVLESAGFSELQIGTKLHPKAILQEMHNLQGYRVQQTQFSRTALEHEGWSLKRSVPGYRLHACVRRTPPRSHGMPDTVTAGTPNMLQAIYTDGLAHVSLFIEPHDSHRPEPEAPPAFGATRMYIRREGEWSITAVGEVPALALQAFAQGLERVKS